MGKKKIILIGFVVVIVGVLCFCINNSRSKNNSMNPSGMGGNIATSEPNIEAKQTEGPAETENPEPTDDIDNRIDKDACYQEKGIYANNKVLQVKDTNGGTLSVGVKTDNSDALYINPVHSSATKEKKIGYYINKINVLQGAILPYIDELAPLGEKIPAPDKSTLPNNVLIDWTYDRLFPAEYVNAENPGISWAQTIGKKDTDIPVRIVAVDLESHNILVSATINIKLVNDKYEIESFVNNQYEVNEEPNITRNELLEQAKQDINIVEQTPEDFDTNTAIVEKTKVPYHIAIIGLDLDRGNFLLPAGKSSTMFAVTLNNPWVSELGHITFYYTYRNTRGMPEGTQPFRLVGYDFIFLDTAEELDRAMHPAD